VVGLTGEFRFADRPVGFSGKLGSVLNVLDKLHRPSPTSLIACKADSVSVMSARPLRFAFYNHLHSDY